MATYKNYMNVWNEDYGAKFFVLSIVIILLTGLNLPCRLNMDETLAWFFSATLLTSVGNFLLYTSFDVLGYKWTLRHNGSIKDPADKTKEFQDAVAAYRVIQHGIFIPIGFYSYQAFGLGSLGFIIPWVFGVADLLYYGLVRNKLPDTWSWLTTWVWILPAGPIWKIIGKPVPNWAVIVNSIIGAILWVIFINQF